RQFYAGIPFAEVVDGIYSQWERSMGTRTRLYRALMCATVALIPTLALVQAQAGGIASRYPRDVGIETDPAVVFVERFDESTLAGLFARWNDILNGGAMSLTSDVPAGSPVATSLTIPWIGGGVSNGGHLYRQLSPGVDDTLYV